MRTSLTALLATLASLPAQHWAYVAPVVRALPQVRDAAWCRNEIDRFVLARLEHDGKAPAREAERPALLRRLALDLTGLPPTPAEVDAFRADTRPDAFERQVDRLLASPRYGERMAQPWLDLARYADTNGYEKDLPRSLWPWRDWLIGALNDDLPFDQMTVQMLAGDLLPAATLGQRVATGFHRNTMLNDEGGVDAEEFRVVAVHDRVATTATVWLGSTIACAQCHDHKHDAFTQREYYGLFAFLNSTSDNGVAHAPQIQVPSAAQRAEKERLEREIAACERVLEPGARDAAQAWWEASLAGTPADPIDDEVTFRDEVAFERGDAFSYGALVEREGDGCVLGRIDDPHAYRGVDLFVNGGKVEVHIVHDWPKSAIKVETTSVVEKGAPHHVLAIYDGSSKAAGVQILLDGVPQTLHVANDTLTGTIAPTVPWRLGSRHASGKLAGTVRDARVFKKALTGAEARAIACAHLRPFLAIPPTERGDAQRRAVRRAYVAATPELQARLDDAVRLRRELAALPIPTTMVLQELEKPRETHVFRRGDFRNPGAVVTPHTPAALPPFAADLPRNRLGLARWLVASDNPLVARVAVNRAWEHFFGAGLVRTSDDFGTQGERPSDQALLDWLACAFVREGWSMKALHRRIVTSRTWRQVPPARRRLDAETLRDQALAIAGLLDDRIGGPSVMPFQPDGVWADSFANYDTPQYRWQNASGADRFRRGIYTYWRRSAAYPAALAFDAPRRDVCTVSRARTNTPLQALILLNDPVYHEAAVGLAERMQRVPASERLRYGFRLCTAREPRAEELELLRRLDSATLVANVLLNLDEVLTR